MAIKKDWKTRLYDAYVSNGQALSVEGSPELAFRPRAPYIKFVIKKYLPYERDTSIIDLGCGHGAYIYFLQNEGFTNVSGIDVSFEQVKLARKMGINCVSQDNILDNLRSTSSNTFGI